MDDFILRSCPFCGGQAVVHVEDGVCVVCTNCGSRTMAICDGKSNGKPTGGAVKSVIETWNKRV